MRGAYRTEGSRVVTAASVAALLVWAAWGVPGLAQQAGPRPGATTFRLLTFEAGGSGPRLGTTVGNGDQEIVDVHNAVLYLLTTGAPEAKSIPAIPIDMRSLIEAGPDSLAAVRSVHRTITRLKAAGTFKEPGGIHRVLHPPTAVTYLPPVLNPSKVIGLAGNYIRRNADGTPGAFDAAEYPSGFLKPPSSLTGHDSEINLEGLLTRGVYEPEMTACRPSTIRRWARRCCGPCGRAWARSSRPPWRKRGPRLTPWLPPPCKKRRSWSRWPRAVSRPQPAHPGRFQAERVR